MDIVKGLCAERARGTAMGSAMSSVQPPAWMPTYGPVIARPHVYCTYSTIQHAANASLKPPTLSPPNSPSAWAGPHCYIYSMNYFNIDEPLLQMPSLYGDYHSSSQLGPRQEFLRRRLKLNLPGNTGSDSTIVKTAGEMMGCNAASL